MIPTSDDDGSAGGISRRSFFGATAGLAGAGALSHVVGPLAETVSGTPRAATAIPWRPFGRTGTQIPVVGFGAGSRFFGTITDIERGGELVLGAIERGIEFVETSANYGRDGISEKMIGVAMKTHRSRVFLETKIDERDYDGAMREMERSMERMNTDYLDLVLHHYVLNSETIAQVTSDTGAERAIRQLVDEGVVRFRGLSTHLPELALEGMERLEPDAIQLPITAVRVPDFEPEVLPTASSRGVAVIAMKTCGNGYFFPANATMPDRIEQYGPPPDAWDRWDLPTWRDHMHYVLSLPVATATIGIDSYFTLEGIVSAASEFSPLTPARMASISERSQVFKDTGYWIPGTP